MKKQERIDNREEYTNEVEAPALMPNLSYDQLMPMVRNESGPRALKALSAQHE